MRKIIIFLVLSLIFIPTLALAQLTKDNEVEGALKVNGNLYSRRYALSDGSTIAVDWNNGNVQSVTLGGNRTFSFTNGQDGGKYVLIIKQGGAGPYTPAWPASVRWPKGITVNLTQTVGKTDYFGFIYNGVDSKYDVVAYTKNL